MDDTKNYGNVVRRIAFAVLLGLAFVASAMLTIYLLFQTGEVRVPNVTGMSQEEAERAVRRAGLDLKLRRQHFDDEVAAGKVSEQDPPANFPVKVGFEVKIDISKGPDPTGTADEPLPVGPTNPLDGPKVQEPTEKKKPKKEEKKEEVAKGDEAKKPEGDAAAKPPKTSDEPSAVKPTTTTAKPKPGDAAKPGETKKPGDAAKKPAAPPRPSASKPPPSR